MIRKGLLLALTTLVLITAPTAVADEFKEVELEVRGMT
jgi:hypothetical protein